MYIFPGKKRNSNGLPSCHLNLRTVAIIGRIKKNDLFSRVDQPHKSTIQPLNTSIHHTDIVFRIQLAEIGLVKFSDGFGVVQGAKGPCVLIRTLIKKKLLFLMASSKFLR